MDTPDKSPVADMPALEAKDHIGRMRSVEQLEQIALVDTRTTVQDAANKRLAELKGEKPSDQPTDLVLNQPTEKPLGSGQPTERPLGSLETGRNLTQEELDDLEAHGWDREYPLRRLTGKQAIDVVNRIDNSDHLEIVIHEDRRMSVVDAARVRLRTTSNDRKRQLAREKWGIYRVEYGGNSSEFKARDEKEAWALFNDANKSSLGPKVPSRKVVKIGDVPAEIPPPTELATV